nr:MAG TPA: hypothetical protein [Caudoviricetes sp.]
MERKVRSLKSLACWKFLFRRIRACQLNLPTKLKPSL